MKSKTAALTIVATLLLAVPALAQTPPATHVETISDLIARLTPAQKEQFDQAGKALNAHQYADALTVLKPLLRSLPGDSLLSKFAGEAALNIGDVSFAVQTLKSIAAGNPDDWQLTALLTRTSAESGDKEGRDTGMAHMLGLCKRGLTPPQMQQYIVEHTKVDTGSILIFASLKPWGPYQVYNYAQIFNSSNQLVLRATVESNDADQPLFAKEHPEKASAGLRRFSLDGYKDTGPNNSNQMTETHFTFKSFEGQPSYDTVREEFINVALGKTKPISSRVNALSH